MPYFDFVNECILTPAATELMPLLHILPFL